MLSNHTVAVIGEILCGPHVVILTRREKKKRKEMHVSQHQYKSTGQVRLTSISINFI